MNYKLNKKMKGRILNRFFEKYIKKVVTFYYMVKIYKNLIKINNINNEKIRIKKYFFIKSKQIYKTIYKQEIM